jgi:hypothetical protein
MRYHAFDFVASLTESAELAVFFLNVSLYYRRKRTRKPAIRRYEKIDYYVDGFAVMNRRFDVHVSTTKNDGYVPLEAVISETRLRLLLDRIKIAGAPAVGQWVEEQLLRERQLWVSVNRTKHLPDIFPEDMP